MSSIVGWRMLVGRLTEGGEIMITGVHALVYSKEAEAIRELFRAVLARGEVDAGDGWPIFALPPPNSRSIRRMEPAPTSST